MSTTKAGADPGAEVLAVAWPELRDQLDRAGGLAAELTAAAEARAALARRLEAALEVRRESLRQGAALDEMRRRLELRRRRAEEAVVGRRKALVGVDRRKEQLQAQIERMLPLSRALAAAHRQVQEAKDVLSGEKARLEDMQRLLRTRQQCMVGQVAALYPVRVFHDPPHAENHRADTNGEHGTPSEENGILPGENGNGTHLLSIIKFPHVRPLTFYGWQFAKHKRKQKSYSDNELQRSAAVLGYAAHHMLLQRSIRVSTALAQNQQNTPFSWNAKKMTRDTEQLLNYIGAESTGRHVFGNLRELIRIIQSDEYVYR